jgi:hypothetical protein
MIITNAKYIKDRDGNNTAIEATIDGIVWGVPLAPDNTHYQAIQEWVAEGNTIAEAD